MEYTQLSGFREWKMAEDGNASDLPRDASIAESDALLDRALRLLEFLTHVQLQKSKPIRSTDSYRDRAGGKVIWFHQLPEHDAVSSVHRMVAPTQDTPFVVIDRVPRESPPEPPDQVRPWLEDTDIADPRKTPVLQRTTTTTHTNELGEFESVTSLLEDHPQVATLFESWYSAWKAWSEKDIRNKPTRDLYQRIFQISEQEAAAPEDFELVCLVGCLSWRPPNHDEVHRHVFTVPSKIEFDENSGRLTVRHDDQVGEMAIELDMLDAVHHPEAIRLQKLRSMVEGFQSNYLDREQIGVFLQRFAIILAPGGRYESTDTPHDCESDPIISYSPALVLRRRSTKNLLRVYQEISSQLKESKQVPFGISQLVDLSDTQDTVEEASRSVDVQDIYLPLPANEQQVRIVQRVDSGRHTVVQGPWTASFSPRCFERSCAPSSPGSACGEGRPE